MLDPHTNIGLEIAIIGMAGRFPGAADLDTFWQHLRDGVEAVQRYTDAQLRERGIPESALADPDYVKAGVPFEGVDRFDAGFFGYTPHDAERLDPQHRVFLECAWAALEDAGHAAQPGPGSVGVYAGCGASVYLLRHLLPRHDLRQGGRIADLLGLLGGNMADALCTRVAYKLDLRGPAVTLQTACSTSLMAVHAACQALLGHECDMALAGGVSLNLLQQQGGYHHQAGAIFSPDGHCRAFDAKAAGTLLGSGAGVVVLKRLDEALRDGDTVHAVIKGSAANNDGADKVGFTAPSVSGQAAVIRAAQWVAGVAADSIGYVEAHGTGTALGDPIEIAALTQAFRAGTAREGFCAVGSVKTNIGHLDAAAGVAGLIKTVLALRHRTLPPSLHFEQPNPRIDFAHSPFYVNTRAQPWAAGAVPRRAGVSAFGIGGTNLHVVLEEAPPVEQPAEAAHWQVLPLSARDPLALEQASGRLAEHLRVTTASLGEVAQTLQLGRRAFAVRRAVVADSLGHAVAVLEAEACVHGNAAASPEVVFLFPGSGVQHANMGLALYRSQPVFAAAVDRCCERLRAELGQDLRAVLFPAPGDEAAADTALARMDLQQPALFVIGYALAQLWRAWGVQPVAMLGHSLGEVVAACLAGVFALDDALHIVAARGRLLHGLPPGAMTAVPLAEAELAPFLQVGCDLAAVNGERLCVLSGPVAAIEAAEQALRAQALLPRRLHVAVAAHSAMTEPAVAALERIVAAVPRRAPQRAFISSVTGLPITAAQATDPAYWGQHLRRTVRFADGLAEVLRLPGRVLVEVGPGEALSALARQHPLAASAAGVWPSQAHPQQPARHAQQMAQALAGLWCAGAEIDWAACHPGRAPRRVPLPTYPFQHRSFWIEAADAMASPQGDPAGPFYVPAWRRADVAAAPTDVALTLVVGGEAGLAAALIAQLQADGVPALRIETGTADRAGHAALLREVAAAHGPVGTLLHLGSLDAPADAVLAHGYHDVVAWAQALEAAGTAVADRCRLLVAVHASADITGQEPLWAEQAMLFPLCKVLGQESQRLDARCVDVVPSTSDAARALLARQLLAEARQPRTDDTAVAWRGPNRWVKAYEPLALQAPPQRRLRTHGVYLITGGLGGVGLALARHLARHWQARLVLLGRSPRPERAHAATVALEAEGAEVLTVAADVADAAAVQAALAAARQRFGALDGVVHAAGVAENGLFGTRTRAASERVFAPKLAGTRVLLEALRCEQLDFMLLCSSIASLAGGLGKSDYAAANAALDALAVEQGRRVAYPVLSVNWDAWRDLGMAEGLHIPAGIGWDGETGARVFEQLVDGPPRAQVVVCTTDLKTRLGALDDGLLDTLAAAPPAALARLHARPPLATPYVAAQGDLETTLAGLWTERLGIGPVGVHDNLFELGGDSLLAIQLLARVRQVFGVELHPAAFFKAPTVVALAEAVEARLIEDIERAAAVPASATE